MWHVEDSGLALDIALAFLILTEDSHTEGGENRNLSLTEQGVIYPAVASGDLALLQKEKHKRKLDPSSGAGGEGPKAIAHTLHMGGARGQGIP